MATIGAACVVAAVAVSQRRQPSLPSASWQTAATFTEADVEAGARMLASENPRGGRALHVEQLWTQIRAAKPGQSLFDRITAGSGWGPQGERRAGTGGVRPVATVNPATDAFRPLTRAVLLGEAPSAFAGARKFFEPAAQDRAVAVADRARQKQAAGQKLTDQEQRLILYRRTAQQIRDKWTSEGARFVGAVDGVEFFT